MYDITHLLHEPRTMLYPDDPSAAMEMTRREDFFLAYMESMGASEITQCLPRSSNVTSPGFDAYAQRLTSLPGGPTPNTFQSTKGALCCHEACTFPCAFCRIESARPLLAPRPTPTFDARPLRPLAVQLSATAERRHYRAAERRDRREHRLGQHLPVDGLRAAELRGYAEQRLGQSARCHVRHQLPTGHAALAANLIRRSRRIFW